MVKQAVLRRFDLEDAWVLANELLKDETRCQLVSTVIYSTILKCFAIPKQINRIFAGHAEIRESRVLGNTIAYNTMIEASVRCGAMDCIPALLEEMKQTHAEPDIIMHFTPGIASLGTWTVLSKCCEKMKKEGKYAADEILYNSLLDGYAKQYRVEEAIQLPDEIRPAGVSPSSYTSSFLVKLLFVHASRKRASGIGSWTGR